MKVFELSIRCIYDYAALITALKLVIDDDGKEQHSVMVSKAEETLVKNWQMKQAYATLRINGSNKEIYYKKYEDI